MNNACFEAQRSDNIPPHEMRTGTFADSAGFEIAYSLLIPKLSEKGKYPLILHFHGAGSWAADCPPPPGQALTMLKADFPAFVLAPKTDRPMMWADCDWTKTEHHQTEKPLPSMHATHELVVGILESEPRIDRSRLYVVGQSMGGFGTWDFVTRYRELAAAAVPVCGGCDVAATAKIRDLPVWIFHGEADDVVPVENSRRLFAELKRQGAPVRYTEYPGVGHASWVQAYASRELFRWLFDRRLNDI